MPEQKRRIESLDLLITYFMPFLTTSAGEQFSGFVQGAVSNGSLSMNHPESTIPFRFTPGASEASRSEILSIFNITPVAPALKWTGCFIVWYTTVLYSLGWKLGVHPWNRIPVAASTEI